jgi:hypothetical protein
VGGGWRLKGPRSLGVKDEGGGTGREGTGQESHKRVSVLARLYDTRKHPGMATGRQRAAQRGIRIGHRHRPRTINPHHYGGCSDQQSAVMPIRDLPRGGNSRSRRIASPAVRTASSEKDVPLGGWVATDVLRTAGARPACRARNGSQAILRVNTGERTKDGTLAPVCGSNRKLFVMCEAAPEALTLTERSCCRCPRRPLQSIPEAELDQGSAEPFLRL